jgi:hypothetical protein
VDALEDDALGLALNGKDALHTEDVLALLLEEIPQPLIEFPAVAFAFGLDADGNDGLVVDMVVMVIVVIVLAMTVLMVAVGMVVVVLVMGVGTLHQEVGFHFQDAAEVEAVNAENAVERDVGVRAAVDFG